MILRLPDHEILRCQFQTDPLPKYDLNQQQFEAERAKVNIAAKRISRAVRMINPAEYQGTISVLNDALAALQSPEVKP